MSFVYDRTIRFHDTDAAGVVYFANVLSICHEAFEESLIVAGIEAQTFFGKGDVAVPIVHASVDFFKPMRCGDRISIHLTPQQIDENTFEIRYEVICDRKVGQALTRHVCIDPKTRTRKALSSDLRCWLQQNS